PRASWTTGCVSSWSDARSGPRSSRLVPELARPGLRRCLDAFDGDGHSRPGPECRVALATPPRLVRSPAGVGIAAHAVHGTAIADEAIHLCRAGVAVHAASVRLDPATGNP